MARAAALPLLLRPDGAARRRLAAGYHLSVDQPRVNIVSAGARLVALLVWRRRRSEVALGSFAALGLLASLRNVSLLGGRLALPLRAGRLDVLHHPGRLGQYWRLFALAVAGRSICAGAAIWLVGGAVMACSAALPRRLATGCSERVRCSAPVLLLGLGHALTLVWRSGGCPGRRSCC